jgi:tRNA threonylcarbamoyladenosine modification (KEOPS) complex  Pcc1 subunit
MSNCAKATIRLKFPNQKQLTTLLSALTPEVEASSTRRANVQLGQDGLFLVLTVEAEDTVALRATLNAYLHWINSTVNVMEVVQQKTANHSSLQ